MAGWRLPHQDRRRSSKTSRLGSAWDRPERKCGRFTWKRRPWMLILKGLTSANLATNPAMMNPLKNLIREIPDYPKPGILFYDITTLLKHTSGFRAVIDSLRNHFAGRGIDRVVGIEARGFIFAPAVAYALSAGFVPMRKPKKLPAPSERMEFALEYG